MSPRARPGAVAACVALCACTPSDAIVCSSGRTVGTSENADMAPGQTCIACHEYTNAGGDGMEAPSFAFAGTVYATAHEPDDCAGGPIPPGGERAEVEVVAADGQRYVAPVTEGGNFMLEDTAIAFPIQATVRFQGRSRAMVQSQLLGDCNLCHSVEGVSGAPGRIMLP
jgi:cytochrome c553